MGGDSRRFDVTSRVERSEAAEHKLGISFEAVYAIYDRESLYSLTVNFDLVADSLSDMLELVISAYNGRGQLMATNSTMVLPQRFTGIDSISVGVDCPTRPDRIRLYAR